MSLPKHVQDRIDNEIMVKFPIVENDYQQGRELGYQEGLEDEATRAQVLVQALEHVVKMDIGAIGSGAKRALEEYNKTT